MLHFNHRKCTGFEMESSVLWLSVMTVFFRVVYLPLYLRLLFCYVFAMVCLWQITRCKYYSITIQIQQSDVDAVYDHLSGQKQEILYLNICCRQNKRKSTRKQKELSLISDWISSTENYDVNKSTSVTWTLDFISIVVL